MREDITKSVFAKLSVNLLFLHLFSAFFLILCAAIFISTVSTFTHFILTTEIYYIDNEIPQVVINAISNLIIALAMFELYVVIRINLNTEHKISTFFALLGSAARFIIVVCVALALEGLVLVIKLVQDEKTEELLAPIAVIFCAGVLLISLGLFLKICPDRIKRRYDVDAETDTAP
ncbi:hypothetical protein [Microbulbifer taiwanensis]|uniref:Phosphate-starvation-inducible PsiE family protein n=1 Tax=Microbulbifer taiwanensis TaxID=986746 RepID=A0ABW1YGS7_9GAMM|nr:hypothetical protein [Microbulbifer taiwanensis]